MTQAKLITHFLWQFRDSARDAMTSSDAAEMALLVLAWLKASDSDQLPPNLRFAAAMEQAPGEGTHALTKLLDSGIVGFRDLRIKSMVGRLDRGTLMPIFHLAHRLQSAGIIRQLEPDDFISAIGKMMPPEAAFLPAEIIALIVKLGAVNPTDSVYVAWDLGAIALLAASICRDVYLETPTYSDIPILLRMLADRPFEIHSADPIKAPSFVDEGRLRRFDVALGMPPFNVKYPASLVDSDWFQRFPEQTASGTILNTRHLLSQSTRRAVIGVANSLTFSSGTEQGFREDLVRRGQVEAVINMPSGLLFNTTIPFSILVLDPRGGHDRIKFVEANIDYFREPVSRTRNRLVHVEELTDLVFNSRENSGTGFVGKADIIANGSVLVGSRYIVPDEIKRVMDLSASERQEPLENLVHTVRPMPLVKKGGDIEVGEISASDLPPYGYIPGPGRNILIDQNMATKNERFFLLPFDILLIIKGSVGKVGLVPGTVPPPGPGGWVAGQSAIVLRVMDDRIDPRALIIQLRSGRGKAWLQHLVSGSTIPLIQLGQLMKMPIAIGSRETMDRAAEAFERETAIQKEIDRLREEQAQVASSLWAL